jgi:16S rRNA (adenine1518-N6/adenine1519-N6)-dimethyltransferase
MNLSALPPLRDVLLAEGLAAQKRFGQHFLLDLNVCRKIARLAGVAPGEVVLEVGPGPGGLTRALLEAGARVIAVEKDRRFAPVLRSLEIAAAGALTIVEADALTVELESLAGGGPLSIVANLPYNVGTPLLVKWLTGPTMPSRMTLMFQKEVALRITAPVGAEHYGRLAILAQSLCDAQIVMELPARAFSPPPKVASAVVRLTPLPERPAGPVIGALQDVARAAFGQRRKTLRSSLRPLGGEALCEAAGVDAGARAETVNVAGFLALARALLERASRDSGSGETFLRNRSAKDMTKGPPC